MFESDQEVYKNHNDKMEYNLSPGLIKVINRIIQNEGYIQYSINIKDISTEGGNFLSLLKEVNIKGKGVKNNKETNLFIKQCLPDSDKNVLTPKVLFLKEIFIYSELAEMFNELQNEFNLPNNEKFSFVKYYNNDGDDSLVFDNMVEKGFKIYDRFDVIPVNAMELSVRQLAKFHGFSFVLKQYRPDFYEKKLQTMKHPLNFDDNGRNFMKSMCTISMEYLDDNKKSAIKKFLPELTDKCYRYIHDNEGKVKCLCHGDYRMNNILVKEINGEAAIAIPIDYQAIYCGSPVIDFLYMIFMTTDRKFRKEHFQNLKKIYFESFTKYVRYFNIDVELVYSQKDFENDFKTQLDYGLITALVVLPFALASDDDVPELNNELKTMSLHSSFKQRIEEIVDDYIEWGYLQE